MLITTEAIVLSSLRFSEADLIVRCFTKKNGIKTYLLRNILKSKKGKLKASLFQPLTQLEIVANHKEKESLDYIKEAKLLNARQSFHSNIFKSSMAIFLAEILKNSIKEEEANVELFLFLEESFNWLDQNENIANFHLIFLLQLTKFMGFYPSQPGENAFVFNMLDGTFQSIKTNNYCIESNTLATLKQLLQANYNHQEPLKLNQEKRNNFLNMILVYYDLHLQNFKKPKSLEVLKEIYS